MASSRRIKRRLTLHVSERRDNPDETWTPGARFAMGWLHRMTGKTVQDCHGDSIQIAGFLAADAAWNAHHYAVNWIDVGTDAPAEREVRA